MLVHVGGRSGAAGRIWPALALAVLAVGAVGCGDDPSSGVAAPIPPDRWPAEEQVAATPIRVGWVPDGYALDTAGEGDAEPILSNDNGGTIEPSLMLVPEGWDGDLDAVVAVGAVDCSGLQGGCGQAVGGGEVDRGEIGGRPAAYTTGGRVEPGEDWWRSWYWPAVMVELGDIDDERDTVGPTAGWAIRVSGPSADRALLTEVANLASLYDDRLPVLSAVPDGWEVVSRVTGAQIDAADAVVGLGYVGEVGADGYVLAWRGPAASGAETTRTEQRLVVASVDGSEANLAAIAALRGQVGYAGNTPPEVVRIEPVEVGGRPGWLSEGVHDVAVVFAPAEGGVVIVNAVGEGRLDRDEVLRLAESVDPLDSTDWDASITGLVGGPGLRPDPGRPELARGTHDGVEWVVQGMTAAPSGPSESWPDFDGPVSSIPDECIKVEGGRRACQRSGQGNLRWGWWFYDQDADSVEITDGPVFVVGVAGPNAATVRVTRPDGDEVIDTIALPGSTRRLFVIASRPGEQRAPFVLLDAAGNEVRTD